MFKGVFLGFLFSCSLIAQNLTGSGYRAPAPVSVAPGQIAIFYAAGLTSSAAVTATLRQQSGNTSAPVLSVRTVSLCPDNTGTPISGCGLLTAVTVQIPYELVTFCPLCANPAPATPAVLAISQNGQTAAAIQLTPLADQFHILAACDVALGPPTPPQPNLTGLPCEPLVTHADGTVVSATSPAVFGETLTAWAFGLGQTNPASTTGTPASMATTAETLNLNFDYEINALPVKLYTGEPDRVPIHPLFSGLAPGYVGLYQINFTVPAGASNGIEQCSLPGAVAPGGDAVQSNLTVSFGGQFSFDGAGICVKTQIPVD